MACEGCGVDPGRPIRWRKWLRPHYSRAPHTHQLWDEYRRPLQPSGAQIPKRFVGVSQRIRVDMSSYGHPGSKGKKLLGIFTCEVRHGANHAFLPEQAIRE